jgi:Tol biopolymer transport system component
VPRLSPDDTAVVVTLTEGDSTDVWMSEVARGSMSRLTFEGNNGAAIWSPDGRSIAFSSDREGAFNLYLKPVDASIPERRLTSSDNAQFPCSWSPDGERLLFSEIDPGNQLDVWVFHLDSGKSEPFLRTPFNESAAVVSPDGRFVAYVSDETGRDEVYVRAFPGPGGKWPISTGGGREPVWKDDGSELFYRDEDWLLSVPVVTRPDFSAGTPRPLFEAPYDEAGAPYASYDVSRDGERFIMVRSGEAHDVSRLIVVLDWFSELDAKLPRSR